MFLFTAEYLGEGESRFTTGTKKDHTLESPSTVSDRKSMGNLTGKSRPTRRVRSILMVDYLTMTYDKVNT